MEIAFDYKSVPAHFSHCFHRECVNRQKCLRGLAADHITAERPYIHSINELCIPEDTNACPYFRLARKITVAWGVKNLVKKLPYDAAKSIRLRLENYFGKTKYYRFYRKERGITPKNQAYIRQCFLDHGIKEDVPFEYFTEEYVWD